MARTRNAGHRGGQQQDQLEGPAVPRPGTRGEGRDHRHRHGDQQERRGDPGAAAVPAYLQGAEPRAGAGRRRVARRKALVQEAAVGTGALLAGHLVARATRGDPGAAARARSTVVQASTASSRRWVETQDAGAAGAGVRDHLEGGLDADRVRPPSNGSSSRSTAGSVHRREHDREPTAHAMAEPGRHPMRNVAELEPLQHLARRGPPSRPTDAAARSAAGAPMVSPAAPVRRRRGSTPPPAWPGAARGGRRTPPRRRCPRSAAPRRPAPASSSTCPRRCGPSSAAASPASARRSTPVTASTSPNRT